MEQITNYISIIDENKHTRTVYINMVIFLLGKLLSLLGSGIMKFAIGLYVLKATGSGMSFALTMIVSVIPSILLSPIAGAIADRGNRKMIVVLTDALSGALLILVYIISISTGLSLTLIFVTLFTLSVLNTFFTTAMEASIPNIVDSKRLTKINSYSSSITSLASILGPVLGGIVYGFFNMELFILLNGISFILSSFSEIFISFKLTKPKVNGKHTKRNVLKDILSGINYVKNQKIMFSLMIFSVFVTFIYSSFSVALPYIVNNKLGLSSEQYGFIQSSFAIGSLLFSLIYSLLPDKNNKKYYVFAGLFVISILMMLTGIPTMKVFSDIDKVTYLIYFITVNFFIGSSMVFINLPFFIMLQRQTSDDYRGRVNGILGTMSLSISPIGMLLGGFFTDHLPSVLLPLVCGILFLLATICIIRQKQLTNLL